MPKKIASTTQLTDEQLTQIFSDIKPVYRPDEAWLKAQRVKLRGEILNGPITAITLPDAWGSSAVTYWVELRRKAD